jgi:hypothetical protein
MKIENLRRSVAGALVAAVFVVYSGFAELAQAQTAPLPTQAATSTEQSGATQGTSAGPEKGPQSSTPTGIVDPSEGPLTPVPNGQSSEGDLPNSPGSTPNPDQTAASQQQATPVQQPVGAAAAQIGPTAGGAASKPAGNAIAPAKQRQTRSFLIKLGAVAAVGIALGTVVALSRGTGSTPPGAR